MEEALKAEKKYTYKEYLNWDDEYRWELIKGVPYSMSPAPTSYHQAISGELSRQISNYLRGKSCKIFNAPFDVRIPNDNDVDEDIETVIQPDLTIVCDRSKIDKRGYKGVPDMIVEILSPSTSKRDREEKYELYEEAGVKEYWIVSPYEKNVTVYILENNKYGKCKYYYDKEKAKISIFEDLEIDLEPVFEDIDVFI